MGTILNISVSAFELELELCYLSSSALKGLLNELGVV